MNTAKTSTIYDVARLAGVSSATVSRVLNEPDKVGEDKRNKVLNAIKELNFIPKADAVANARKSYRKIGVIAPFFTQPSFMERLRGIARILAPEHYELVIYSIDSTDDLNNYVSAMVTTMRVDGLIFLCVHLERPVLNLLHDAKFPVCFVESDLDNFDCVNIHNLRGGQKAAEYLYQQGCRRPGFLGEQSKLSYAVTATEDRFRGFKFYFANQGIIIPPEHVWIGEFTDQQLDKGIMSFLKAKTLPDCVFCSSDLIAARFVHLAREAGLQVPKDIKVLGFDNVDISGYIGLSTVNQNLDMSGKAAAELILARMKEPERPVVNMNVPLDIIERETTK
ncbi:MAG: LacI family DNA-binding transcriptional regulator [Treponema sp.]|nr:LacI family DNA-binding transcriptional regulator [Treponema sp.]